MTEAQNRVYKAIKLLIERTGHSPSYKEIGRVARISSLACVHGHVKALEKGGYIIRQGHYRGLVVAPDHALPGFHRCDKRHEIIFFQSGTCPLCKALDEVFPPRVISVEESA